MRAFQLNWGTWKGKRELRRGLIHVLPVHIAIIAIQIIQVSFLLGLAFFTFGFTVCFLDTLRAHWIEPIMVNGEKTPEALRWKRKHLFLALLWNRFYPWLKEHAYRDSEYRRISSALWSVPGFFFAWLLFPSTIALLAISFSVADPMAKIIGIRVPESRRFNRGPAKGKSLTGCLAGLLTCLSVSILIWSLDGVLVTPLYHEYNFARFLTTALVGGIVAVLAELWSGKFDNGAMPVFAVLAMWLCNLALF